MMTTLDVTDFHTQPMMTTLDVTDFYTPADDDNA